MSNTDVSAKEFGALQAKVEYIKDGVDRHTAALERIENILSGNISRAELEQYKKGLTDEVEQKYLPRCGKPAELLAAYHQRLGKGICSGTRGVRRVSDRRDG